MSWMLRVRIGDALTIEHIGPAAAGAPAGPLPQVLNARWVDELDAEQPWPSQQLPSSGTLEVLFASAADAAAIESGTVVRLEVFTPPTAATPVASFHGRAGDPELTPHDLGVVASMALADFRADLAEDAIGDSAWPEELMEDRIDRAFAAAGRIAPVRPTPPDPVAVGFNGTGYLLQSFTVVARPAAAATLLDVITETTRAGVWSLGERLVPGGPVEDRGIYGMMELRPGVDAAGDPDPDATWVYEVLHNDTQTHPLGELEAIGGVWTVLFPDAIPADRVAFDYKWTRPLHQAYNTVAIVDGDQVIAAATNRTGSEPRVTVLVPSLIRYADSAAQLADWLLPAPGVLSAWQAGSFDVLMNQAPEGWWPGGLRDVRVLTELPTVYHPDGGRWWAGAVNAVEVRASSGSMDVLVTMRPVPLTPAAAPVTWDDLNPAMTWANTDPATTWADLELIETTP